MNDEPDSRTQFHNRLALEREVSRELERLTDAARGGSLASIEISNLKEINDGHGAEMGVRVVAQLVDVLRRQMGDVDIAGRYSDKEIVAYFPETDCVSAAAVIERVCARFMQGGALDVPISPLPFAGVAEAPRDGGDFATLYSHAARAMSHARDQNKAKVVIWRNNLMAEKQEIPTMGGHAPSKKILVADDEKKIRQLISETLTSAGFQTKTVKNADDVVPSVRAWKPDLIILDIMMPGTDRDGGDVCKEIKSSSESEEIPVVLVSGLTQGSGISSEKIRKRLRAEAYLEKPFDINELCDVVRSLTSASGAVSS